MLSSEEGLIQFKAKIFKALVGCHPSKNNSFP